MDTNHSPVKEGAGETEFDRLLGLLPAIPERTDNLIVQLTDLVKVAQRLGMTEAACYLQERLDFDRKWYGPKPLHPEQRSGEIHLLNDQPEKVRYIGWKTKRIGEVAYDVDGNVEPGKVPVFVLASEFEKSGQLTERFTIAR